MSSPDVERLAPESAACIAEATAALAAALDAPDRVPSKALQNLICQAVRLYAAKAENGLDSPFPARGGGVTTDDVMIMASDMLHALNVQLFELSMWQAMTGHCIKSRDRLDSPA
jgi:hypothetical protein